MPLTSPEQTRRWAVGVARSLKPRIDEALGLELGAPLAGACGGHGCVFDTDKRALLVKITDHAEEAAAAHHVKALQSSGWLRDIVRIKSVHRLPTAEPAWIIVRERVRPAKLDAASANLLWETNLERFQLYEQRRGRSVKLDPTAMRLWPLLQRSKALLAVQRLLIELLHLGMTDLDLLANNLGVRAFRMKGWSAPGSLVLLDTGGIVDLQGRPLSAAQIPALPSRGRSAANRAMFRARFALDDSPTWSGWTDGRTWNGFATPWFDRATTISILSWLETEGAPGFRWKIVDGDVFYRFAEDDDDQWEVVRPEQYGYPLGNHAWTWWNMDLEEAGEPNRTGRANMCPGQTALEAEFARLLGRDESGGHCELVPARKLQRITRKHGWKRNRGIVGFHTPDNKIYVREDAEWSVGHELAHRYGLDDDHIARWLCEALTEFTAEEACRNVGEPHQRTYGHERSLVLDYVVPATGKQPLELARIVATAELEGELPNEIVADLMLADPHWRKVGRASTLRAISSGSGDKPDAFLNLAPRKARAA